jgi:hypothetical protein
LGWNHRIMIAFRHCIVGWRPQVALDTQQQSNG